MKKILKIQSDFRFALSEDYDNNMDLKEVISDIIDYLVSREKPKIMKKVFRRLIPLCRHLILLDRNCPWCIDREYKERHRTLIIKNPPKPA